MKAIKSLAPVLFLVFLAIFVFRHFDQLSSAIRNAIVFLPFLLVLLVSGLSIHFSRSRLFFYVLLLIMTYLVLSQVGVAQQLSYGVYTVLMPVLMWLITVLPERGIFTVRALPGYIILLVAIVMMVLLKLTTPMWVADLILNDWLPSRYFDWTPLPQTALIVSTVVFIYLLVLSFLQPSTHRAAGLGIFVMLLAELHIGAFNAGVSVFSSAAFLMCLYAVMQESWRMAYLDELTELPARRALREKFQKIGGLYTVAMVDVDHFKKFNDTYGHDTGDAVLRMIAGKLGKVTGSGSAYRYGGEEFTLVFNGKDREQALPHLQQLREIIANSPFVINREDRRQHERKSAQTRNKTVTVTVSIGVADSSKDSGSPWDVMKSADKALYRAKKKGRNCVCS